MKKLFTLILGIILIMNYFVFASAEMSSVEEIDFDPALYSVEELLTIKEMIDDYLSHISEGQSNENQNSSSQSPNGLSIESKVLYSKNGVTVYLTGDVRGFTFMSQLYIDFVIINDSNQDIKISFADSSINGWEVMSSYINVVHAGNKMQDHVTYNCDAANVRNADELNELSFCLEIWDATFHMIDRTERITITFNNN